MEARSKPANSWQKHLVRQSSQDKDTWLDWFLCGTCTTGQGAPLNVADQRRAPLRMDSTPRSINFRKESRLVERNTSNQEMVVISFAGEDALHKDGKQQQ